MTQCFTRINFDFLFNMLKHHLKIFFRKLLSRDTTTYINAIGLSIGLTCAMLIMLWIQNELTYDTFHENFDDIYRIKITDFRDGIQEDASPITMVPLGPALHENTSFLPLLEQFESAMRVYVSANDVAGNSISDTQTIHFIGVTF